MKEIDLSSAVVRNPSVITKVPYAGQRSNEGPYRLFMVITLHPVDCSVFYLFFGYNPSVDLVSDVISANAEIYGDNLVIIDTGESFSAHEDVEAKAKAVKHVLPNVNVYLPAIIISQER